jgi:hypothetical protein
VLPESVCWSHPKVALEDLTAALMQLLRAEPNLSMMINRNSGKVEGKIAVATTPKLFSPFILGTIILRHRIVMAPLTRLRSDQPGDIPGDLMAEYYTQRASPGGFIVTESTEITPEASAYEGAPGIYTEAQMAGWRKITDAIHRKEG